MHLKTLTLRGFKSFAQATRLTFEPGITCVVGPNGAGKSNVVDALTWVMGEQGAKSLRGGKMEDVIFAGTSTRAALGRAEVKLTIDNTDGALPIDYTEVTIARTLFRNGNSEYAINGSACRLLDIQELLSDSGMGREMHVIVGQGQLDAVLTASPDERRGFIEEAAGILKHRKRKERAQRKIESMQANLLRLTDLAGEVRRQLGPLGRQADVARRAQSIQAALRDSTARLLASDAAQVKASLGSEAASESALVKLRAALETELSQARGRLVDLEASAARAVPEASRASDQYFRLATTRERLRALADLASERARNLGGSDFRVGAAGVTGAGSAAGLEALAASLKDQLADAETRLDQARHLEVQAQQARQEAETEFSDEDSAYATAMRALADQRESLATLAGQVNAARAVVEGRASEVETHRQRLEAARAAGAEATAEFTELEQQIAGVESGEASLDLVFETATAQLEQARANCATLLAEQDAARSDMTSAAARREALELTLEAKDAAGALLDRGSTMGALASLITVEPGWENAIGAALGSAAEALAVTSAESAVDNLRLLRDQSLGRAGLVIAAKGASLPARGERPPEAQVANVTFPARWADELVSAKGQGALAGAVSHLLDGVVAVENLAQARKVVAANSHLRAVTRDGDLLGAHFAYGGAAGGPSVLELRSELAGAEQAESRAKAVIERTTFELAKAQAEADQLVAEQAQALDALTESDTRHAAVAERLGQLTATVAAQNQVAAQAESALDQASQQLLADQAALESLAQALEAARSDPEAAQPSGELRDQLAGAAQMAREAAGEAALEVKAALTALATLTQRLEATDKAAATERQAEANARASAARRAEAAARAKAVAQAAQQLQAIASQAETAAREQRDQVESTRAEREAGLTEVRGQIDQLRGQHEELTDQAHREELAKAALTAQLDQIGARAAEDLGLDIETLLAEFGPDQPVPADTPDGEATPFDRPAQEKRQRKAERELRTLGKVNPLALEEFTALEERHQFLTDQLADLKKSKADLLNVIGKIDERVHDIFAAAFEDTARSFGEVFARLFPGGDGRLVATDPEDWLVTGVDIEARPAGKSVKRLSLLSGGERSLVAIAFQLAIFMARPSPFYILDEVEAALDEVNLARLMEIVAELRTESQIIMVTHQRRTMEVADALYGVTMRGDGVTTVISQRIRAEAAELPPAQAS